ncbi:MAG: hypothetical protein WCX74_04395, partial [Candidatus Paceibacterota bacterium]
MNKFKKVLLIFFFISFGSIGQIFAACSECPPIVEPACGAAAGGTYENAPTTNLCVAGSTTSGAFVSNEYWKYAYQDEWKWICGSPSTQRTVNCYANRTPGQCGTASGQTLSSAPTSNFCKAGTFSGLSGSGPWTWTCWNPSKVTGDYCTAYKASSPVNGQCGYSNGQTFSSTPTTNLCNSGTAGSVSGTGPWYWSCSGTNGGSTANCSAYKTASPVNGQCGYSNGGSFSSTPTAGLCNSGTASGISGTGPWYWSCTGTNGGSTSSCYANKTVTPVN